MAATDIEESSSHTRSVKNSLKHTWVIDNFSHFYVRNAESTDPEYPRIYSVPFNFSQDKQIQFRIQVFPNGFNEENKDYISVGLEPTFKEAAKVLINFKLSILNDKNKKKYSHDTILVFKKTIGWAWHKFVEQKVLLDKTTGLLVNDQLTILCEIEMYREPVSKLAIDVCLENLKSLSIAKGSEMYGDLLESGDHSDVILVLEDGEEKLKAHKAILSARSPVFQAMFECDMKEKAEGRVVIEDLSIDVAKELLKFVYTGSVELLDSSAEEILSAADKYGLDLLKQICGQYLCGKVTTDNVARFLALAEAHSVDELKRTCIKYIRGHLVEVMLTQDWPLVDKLVIEELRQEEEEDDDKEEGEGEKEGEEE